MQLKTQQFVRCVRCKWANIRLFVEQPDDGPITRPKHVVVYYIMLLIT